MTRSSLLVISTLGFSTAAIAAACGARSDLPVGAGASAGASATTTTTSPTTTTIFPDAGTGGGPSCNDSPSPECLACDGDFVLAECKGTTWVCPPFECACDVATWQKTATGVGHQAGAAIAVGPDGSISIGAVFGGSINLGGTTFQSSEPDIYEVDAVVARWLPDGTHLWSRAFGTTKDEFIDDIAVTNSGETVVIGTYRDAQSLDGLLLPGGSTKKMFLARLSPGGLFVQAMGFVGGANGTRGRIDVLPDGGVVIAGDTSGTLTWSGGTLTGSNNSEAIVIRLDPSGNTVWARRFAGTSHASATDVAAAPDGSVVVTGAFRETIDFGLGSLASQGVFDAFLVRLDPNGNVVQSTSFGGPGADVGQSVIVDSAGNVVLMASHEDGADFGAGPLFASDEAGVVVSYTPSGGFRWQAPFTGVTSTLTGADRFFLARGADDHVLLSGQFEGTFVLGNQSVTSAGDYDIVIARLSSGGQVLGACSYGSQLADLSGGLAVDAATGDALMAGQYWGSIDFGLGKMNNGTDGNLFAVRLPAGGVK